MPKYIVERELPGAGEMGPDELRAVSEKSVSILRDMGPDIQWVQSYITDDKVYCVYNAPSPDLVEEHARCAGLPADRISPVQAIVDPTTAESAAGVLA